MVTSMGKEKIITGVQQCYDDLNVLFAGFLWDMEYAVHGGVLCAAASGMTIRPH